MNKISRFDLYSLGLVLLIIISLPKPSFNAPRPKAIKA